MGYFRELPTLYPSFLSDKNHHLIMLMQNLFIHVKLREDLQSISHYLVV